MKRILALLFALLLLVPSLAFADVIIEPENSFYRTHQKDCEHSSGRTYLANGPDGTLNAYTAPNGIVTETLKNGTAFFCQWTYTDGQGAVWGYSERHNAWIPLGYTLVQYDHISFQEEYADKIEVGEDRTMDELPVAFLYECPGAPNPIQMERIGLTTNRFYTDEQGRLWGYISYIYGIRDKWFCLDDPGNGELTTAKREDVPSSFDAPVVLPTVSKTGIIAGAVGGIALVTLAVVLILFRKKRKAN